MKHKSIKTYSDLKHEQSLLRLQLQNKETQLLGSWVYLKSNYKKMVWKEVNPFKGSSILHAALNLVQPGLLPIIAEVAKGTVKGSPVNLKVVATTAKYAIASLGIKWLRKWLDNKEESETEMPTTEEIPSAENTL